MECLIHLISEKYKQDVSDIWSYKPNIPTGSDDSSIFCFAHNTNDDQKSKIILNSWNNKSYDKFTWNSYT